MGDTSSRPTVSEAAAAYFHQKYGSKSLVDDYMGSLVASVAQFKQVLLLPLAPSCQLAIKFPLPQTLAFPP